MKKALKISFGSGPQNPVLGFFGNVSFIILLFELFTFVLTCRTVGVLSIRYFNLMLSVSLNLLASQHKAIVIIYQLNQFLIEPKYIVYIKYVINVIGFVFLFSTRYNGVTVDGHFVAVDIHCHKSSPVNLRIFFTYSAYEENEYIFKYSSVFRYWLRQ